MTVEIVPTMNDELFDLIISEVYEGLTPSKAAAKHKIKHKAFREYAQQSPDRLMKLAHAEDACADYAAAEIIEISDTEVDQLKSRNRIDARKWLASKFRPQKYGDRLDLNINKIVDISGALAEAAGRLIPTSYPDQQESRQVIEIIANHTTKQSGYEPDEPELNESLDIFK